MEKHRSWKRFWRKERKDREGDSVERTLKGQVVRAQQADVPLSARNATSTQLSASLIQPNAPLETTTSSPHSRPDHGNSSSKTGIASTKRDYWAEAAEKLQRTKPEVFQKLALAIHENSKTSETLEERIQQVLTESITAITDRQWRIKWGSRLNVSLRGVVDNVVKALIKFKDVGSAAASLDPVHAGLPWAAICVLLPLALNLSSQEQAAKSGLDKVSMILARYSAMEGVYIQQDGVKLTKTLEDLLVELYTKILEYQAVAACFFSKSSLGRYGRAIPKWDDFVGVLKEVQDLDSECVRVMQALEAEINKRSGKMLEGLFKLAEQILEKLQSQTERNEEIILWLSNVKYGGDHDRARRMLGSSYTKSGQWLLKGASYLDWKGSHHPHQHSSVFWLRGPVGTGKTSLTSIVIQEHLENLQLSTKERLVYFYCSEKEQPPTTSLEVLRSMLAQLSWSSDGLNVTEEIKNLYMSAHRLSGAGRPDNQQCVELMLALTSARLKVTIIIDALDECADPWTLLSSLKEISTNLSNTVSFFFSSRMHIEVSKYFPDCITVGPGGNTEDIENYIKNEMAIPHQRLLGGNYPELEKRLSRVLTDRAQNMFRWVELELQLFLSPRYSKYWKDVESNLNDLESRVGNGVPQLNETYETIYRMNTEGQPLAESLARRTLKWLMLSLVPLDDIGGRSWQQAEDTSNVVGLDAVVGIISTDTDSHRDLTIDKDLITNICSNLVIFDESTNTFRFAHLSVVEYLQQRVIQNTNALDKEFSFVHVSIEVATSCLSWIIYLAHEKGGSEPLGHVPQLRPILQRSYTTIGPVPTIASIDLSLLRFSVLYWPLYYRYALSDGGGEEASFKILENLVIKSHGRDEFNFWVEEYKQSSGVSLPQFPYNSDNRVEQAWDEDMKWHLPKTFTESFSALRFFSRHPVHPAVFYNSSGSPLKTFAAATYGIESVIETATDAEISERNVFNQTSLQIAAARGHLSIVKSLLERPSIRQVINFPAWNDGFWNGRSPHMYPHFQRAKGTALSFAHLRVDNDAVIDRLILSNAV